MFVIIKRLPGPWFDLIVKSGYTVILFSLSCRAMRANFRFPETTRLPLRRRKTHASLDKSTTPEPCVLFGPHATDRKIIAMPND